MEDTQAMHAAGTWGEAWRERQWADTAAILEPDPILNHDPGPSQELFVTQSLSIDFSEYVSAPFP